VYPSLHIVDPLTKENAPQADSEKQLANVQESFPDIFTKNPFEKAILEPP
jgi:hypothetical protein